MMAEMVAVSTTATPMDMRSVVANMALPLSRWEANRGVICLSIRGKAYAIGCRRASRMSLVACIVGFALRAGKSYQRLASQIGVINPISAAVDPLRLSCADLRVIELRSES